MDILQRPNALPSDTGLMNLITPTYLNRNMNGQELFVEMLKKKFPRIYLKHWEKE